MSQNKETVLGLPARDTNNGSDAPRPNRSRSRPRSLVYKRPTEKVNEAGASGSDLPSDSQGPAPKRARSDENKELEVVTVSERDTGRNDSGNGGNSSHGHRSGPNGGKSKFYFNFAHTHNCPIVEDKHNIVAVLKHFRSRGCNIPQLSDMQDRNGYSEVLENFSQVAGFIAAFMRTFDLPGEATYLLSLLIQSTWQVIAAFHRYVAVSELRRATPSESGKAIDNLASMLKTAQDRETAHLAEIQQLASDVNDLNAKICELEDTLQQEREARETAISVAVDSATKKVTAKHREGYARLKAKLEKQEGDAIFGHQMTEVDARLDMIAKMKRSDFDLEAEETRLKGHLSDLELDLSMAEVSNLNAGPVQGDHDLLELLEAEPLATVKPDSARRID